MAVAMVGEEAALWRLDNADLSGRYGNGQAALASTFRIHRSRVSLHLNTQVAVATSGELPGCREVEVMLQLAAAYASAPAPLFRLEKPCGNGKD